VLSETKEFAMRNLWFGLSLLLFSGVSASVQAGEITGHYLEARTCQVYTGPCFANGETGLAGKEALMAWKIHSGQQDGVELTDLSVVVAVSGDNTLGFRGLNDAAQLKSMIFVDERATETQRQALVDFAKQHAGKAGAAVVRVTAAPISMSLDEEALKGKLNVGNKIQLETRKAGRADCICSNEAAYYPPLAQVQFFAPGVTEVGEFQAGGLGKRWSIPGARSAYMATFAY